MPTTEQNYWQLHNDHGVLDNHLIKYIIRSNRDKIENSNREWHSDMIS